MARHDERLYGIWTGIKGRTQNHNNKCYKNYGGRGITVCDEWENSYEAFRDWALANGYQDDLTIDRIDNDGNYCPENCRWVDRITQNNNRRSNHFITHNGETKTITQWARETGLNSQIISGRLKLGWSIEDALSIQKNKK